MPELYTYVILALAALVAVGFYLVLRDDREAKQRTAERKSALLPMANPAEAELPRPAASSQFPEPAVLPSGNERGVDRPPPTLDDVRVPQRRRRPAQQDEAPMQALVAHLSREVEELRAERAALKEEARQLRGALADAMVANRTLEAKLGGSDSPAHGNVYNLPTKRVS